MHLKNRIVYFKENWKQCVHILLRTSHFGVNNEWWLSFPSLFGWLLWKIIWSLITICPMIRNYREIKIRASLGLIHPHTAEKIGWK
jgi:hypothetical protein